MTTTDLLRVLHVASERDCCVKLIGEADFSVLHVLSDALQTVALRRGQDVRLDVADLHFIDVACMRALMSFFRRAARAGVSVHVVDANSEFTLLADLFGGEVLRGT